MCAVMTSVLCSPYGALSRADIKRNFAFVEFRRVEDAIKVGLMPTDRVFGFLKDAQLKGHVLNSLMGGSAEKTKLPQLHACVCWGCCMNLYAQDLCNRGAFFYLTSLTIFCFC